MKFNFKVWKNCEFLKNESELVYGGKGFEVVWYGWKISYNFILF